MKHGYITLHQRRKERQLSREERAKPGKSVRDTTVSRQGHGLCILGHAILLVDFLPKGQTINSDYYIALLNRLEDAIKKKRPHMAKKKSLFPEDNAPVHQSMKTMVKLNDLRFELLPDPPYSPDLAPSDFYLFADLKRCFRVRDIPPMMRL